MNVNALVSELDRHLEFLRAEVSSLERRPEAWAGAKANRLKAIAEVVRQYRQDKVMAGVTGKRIE